MLTSETAKNFFNSRFRHKSPQFAALLGANNLCRTQAGPINRYSTPVSATFNWENTVEYHKPTILTKAVGISRVIFGLAKILAYWIYLARTSIFN